MVVGFYAFKRYWYETFWTLNVKESLGSFTGARHQHYISPSQTNKLLHFQARLLLHYHHSPVRLAPHHTCQPPTTNIPHPHPLTINSPPCFPITLVHLPSANPLPGYTLVTKSNCVRSRHRYRSHYLVVRYYLHSVMDCSELPLELQATPYTPKPSVYNLRLKFSELLCCIFISHRAWLKICLIHRHRKY